MSSGERKINYFCPDAASPSEYIIKIQIAMGNHKKISRSG
jgi:hypothetical protein